MEAIPAFVFDGYIVMSQPTYLARLEGLVLFNVYDSVLYIRILNKQLVAAKIQDQY